MEAVIQNGIADCTGFISGLDSLETRLNEQLLFLAKQQEVDEEMCQVEETEYDAERAELESQIRSHVSKRQIEEAEAKQIRMEQLEQKQKVLTLKTKRSNLENECEILEHRFAEMSRRQAPKADVPIYSTGDITQFIIPGKVFDHILSFLSPRCILLMETVCVKWKKAICSWPGWMRPQEYIPGTRKFNFSSRPTRQHWPRFSMHIEFDQKRSIWNIRVEGKVENEIQAPVHNMKKNKSGTVILDISEDSRQLVQEYNVCDVILKTNHKLARLKLESERFRNKLENNEAIKKGFKVQTEHLKRQINTQMTKNNGLATQLKSDQHTTNYLSLRCSQLANEFKDLEAIPKRIKLETRKANKKVDSEVDKIRIGEVQSLNKEISKLKKIQISLVKEVRKEEGKLQEATAQRDVLKKKYHELKEQINVMTLL